MCQFLYTDIRGKRVERTKKQYPYSYEPYCVYKDDYQLTDSTVYSDRLFEWDSQKFMECYHSIWGTKSQSFNKDPKEIEQFLSLYYGETVHITGIEIACNFSTGYPYWVFYYRKGDNQNHE